MTTTPPEQLLLSEDEVDAIAKPFLRHLGGDHWYSGEEGIADHEGYAKALQSALLAKLREQQPVAEWVKGGFGDYLALDLKSDYAAVVGGKLYAAPVPTPAASDQERDDINALVRRLDVALNGEDGAARQASLCDIVSQVEVARTAPAQAAQAVPAGWKLMPVEPNTEMLDAVSSCHEGRLYPQDFVHGPRAMRRQEYATWLAAAPTPTGAGDEGCAA